MYITLEGNKIVGGGEGDTPGGAVEVSQDQYNLMRDHLIGAIAFTYNPLTQEVKEDKLYVDQHIRNELLKRLEQVELNNFMEQAIAGTMSDYKTMSTQGLRDKITEVGKP